MNHKYSSLILRAGLSFVFLWFGFNQIMDQSSWTSLIPSFVTGLTGLTAKTVVIFNGVFEVVMAVLLVLGVRVRIVASLLFLHMVAIIGDLGLNAIAVRDIGLMFALLSIAFTGQDQYCLRAPSNNEETISVSSLHS